MVGQLFLAVPRGSLQFVIVVFPDHTHLLFMINLGEKSVIIIKKTNNIGPGEKPCY